MKILLTGVTGFVGSHLATYLFERGFSVYGLIRRPIEDSNLLARLKNIDLRIFTDDNLIELVSDIKPDVVVHLASLYLTTHNYKKIDNLIKTNVTFPTKLFEAMCINNVTKLINTGTSWEHYNSSDYDPVNLYAATKQACSDILEFYTSAKGFSSITLKLFDTYGQDDPRGKLISLLDQLSVTQECLAMSAGEQVVELTHIDDVCSAYLLSINILMDMKPSEKKTFGVDSDNRLKLKNLVSIYERTNNVSLNIKWGEKPYRDREVMLPCENLPNVPGWVAKIDLHHGLKIENRLDK